MGQSVLDSSVFQSSQENAGQKPDGICGAQIKWALPDSINGFLQQLADLTYTFQRPVLELTVANFPSSILESSLPAQFGQFLRMRMTKTQACFYSWRPALAASLRIFALHCSGARCFEPFLRLRFMGTLQSFTLSAKPLLGLQKLRATSVQNSDLFARCSMV